MTHFIVKWNKFWGFIFWKVWTVLQDVVTLNKTFNTFTTFSIILAFSRSSQLLQREMRETKGKRGKNVLSLRHTTFLLLFLPSYWFIVKPENPRKLHLHSEYLRLLPSSFSFFFAVCFCCVSLLLSSSHQLFLLVQILFRFTWFI